MADIPLLYETQGERRLRQGRRRGLCAGTQIARVMAATVSRERERRAAQLPIEEKVSAPTTSFAPMDVRRTDAQVAAQDSLRS